MYGSIKEDLKLRFFRNYHYQVKLLMWVWAGASSTSYDELFTRYSHEYCSHFQIILFGDQHLLISLKFGVCFRQTFHLFQTLCSICFKHSRATVSKTLHKALQTKPTETCHWLLLWVNACLLRLFINSKPFNEQWKNAFMVMPRLFNERFVPLPPRRHWTKPEPWHSNTWSKR